MEVDFMTYKEKENLLKIQNVTATMAIEGMYFNTIKTIYEKPTASLILNGKKLKTFPSGKR